MTEERYREALERILAQTMKTGHADELTVIVMNTAVIAKEALAEPTVTEPSEPLCPKCKTAVEWVMPPIPGVKPFFQCQDPDCNWMSDDGIPPPATACPTCKSCGKPVKHKDDHWDVLDCIWLCQMSMSAPQPAKCPRCGTEHKTPGSLEQPSAYCPVQTVTLNTTTDPAKSAESAEGERCAYKWSGVEPCGFPKECHGPDFHAFVPPGPAPEGKEQ